MSQLVGLPSNSYKPITNTVWVRSRLCRLQKSVHSTRSANDNAYQLLAHGRWLSPGTPASSTTKTGRHAIAEIMLKVALNTINHQINKFSFPTKILTKDEIFAHTHIYIYIWLYRRLPD